MKKIAVVILNWNGTQLLQEFLPSILAHSAQADIFVADNASTDGSVAFLQKNFPEIQIIQNDENFGFAQGYNQALLHINHQYLALVNSDIQVTPNWLQPITDTFEAQPQTAIIQPKILSYKQKDYFEYAGAAGGFIDKFGYPYCRGRVFETLEKDTNQYPDACEIFWASGACFFIRNQVFKALNGFDPDFFAHQEEIDLCWRAQNKGFKVVYNPYSTVYHVGGATLETSNPKKTFLNFRNSLFMLVKNLPKNRLFPILFLRLVLDGVAGLKFVLQGNYKHTIAILKAHFWFYKRFKSNYKKRDTFQQTKYYHTKSIVFDYYISGIKTF